MADSELTGQPVSTPANVPPANGTPAENVKPVDSQATELETLKKKLSELEGRIASVPDADSIAEKVVQHPRMKQSQRDMIQAQVQAQIQNDIDRRTEAIDSMLESGEITVDVAEKQRRAISRRVKEEYAKQPPPAQAEPMPLGDTAETRVEAARVAAGVEWAELGFTPGAQVTERDALARITKVAAEKRAAQLVEKQKADWVKEYEAKAKAADEQVKAATGGVVQSAPPVDKLDPKKILKNPASMREAYKNEYPDSKI